MKSGPGLLPREIGRAAAAHTGLIEYFKGRLDGLEGLPQTRYAAVSKMLAAAAGHSLTNSDVRQSLGCSDSTAKNILRAMVQAGLLESVGRRGGRHYQVLEPKEE